MKKKILIVEDEFIVANDLAIMLEASGYEMTGIAISAKAAIEEIEKNIPDIVLLDIQLQGAESGIDLAGKLKAMHIAFVYLSANSDQVTLQKAKATEPYGFLVKPVRPKDLLVTLDIACYRHEHSRESYLFRKDRFRGGLAVLVNEERERAYILSRFAELLQIVVPFDFIGFVFLHRRTGYEFRGLYRSGFNEYQEIDKAGLGNITSKSPGEIDALLSDFPANREIQSFAGDAYGQLEKEDQLACLLGRCYSFRSAIRGVIGLPAGPQYSMYICSRESNGFDDRHLSVIEEVRDLIGRLLTGLGPERKTTLMPAEKDRDNVSHSLGERFIGRSKSTLHCLDLVAQVAPLNTSVLITGESGTGKELVAEAIHELSPRKAQPCIKINCAALPYTLIESELFGYEKGAFTGALTSRMGKFEAASGGTIFLDEIAEMGLDVQAKLLRVLQEKKVQRVGSHKEIETDVRIIAATNRNLEEAVAEHRFRLDLYFRLNVFPIQLPPLRHRKEDIALLADYLGRKIAKGMGRIYYGIADEMMEALKQYDWPGNVRELENVIERALIVSGQHKPMTLLQPLISLGSSVEPPISVRKYNTIDEIKQRQEQNEKELIEVALREARGRVRGPGGAAEKLDIKPTTLESKLIRLGIRKEDFR